MAEIDKNAHVFVQKRTGIASPSPLFILAPVLHNAHAAGLFFFMEESMGANSTQGVAVMLVLIAFTCLSLSLFNGFSIIYLLGFLVALGASVSLFLKAKPWEHQE